MAADDKTPTGRDLDKALDHAVASLEIRHEKRLRNQLLSSPEEEDTGVIESEALQRVKAGPSSTPPRAKALVAILHAFPPGSRPYVAVLSLALVLGALVYSGAITALVDWAKK
jgi:hypothetical protein